jgi:hypothetical protein
LIHQASQRAGLSEGQEYSTGQQIVCDYAGSGGDCNQPGVVPGVQDLEKREPATRRQRKPRQGREFCFVGGVAGGILGGDLLSHLNDVL